MMSGIDHVFSMRADRRPGPRAPGASARWAALASASVVAFAGASALSQTCDTFSPLGSGLNFLGATALVELPNGHLIAGGSFSLAGSVSASNIARWDGTNWHALGSGVNHPVTALAVLQNGHIVAGGTSFTLAGAVSANRIARWDGTHWHSLGGGLDGDGSLRALTVLSNGDLVAGGAFTSIGGVSASNIARWDGTNWNVIGPGLNGTVYSLTVAPTGDLVAGGQFTGLVARWNGLSWQTLPGLSVSQARAVAVRPSGEIIAGGFSTVATNRVARWNGTSWQPMGSGLSGSVDTLSVLANGDVAVGGQFTATGDGLQILNHVARWDGVAWHGLGSGVNNIVASFLARQNGDLVVGGRFTTANGVSAAGIATWTDCITNLPPVAVCNAYPTTGAPISGSDLTLACDASGGRHVTLDATGSYDPDAGDLLTYRWDTSNFGVVLDSPDSAVATGLFPMGVTMATLTVTDPSGAFSTCDVIVRIQDNTPPQVMVTTNLAALWPANHTMRAVQVIVTATDECFAPNFIFPINVMLRSNEIDGSGDHTGDSDGQDGHSAPVDITSAFAWDATLGAWVATIHLRAERLGSGRGRAYAIDALAFDGSSNFGSSSCVIVVPKSMGGGN
jgi:hypothetical protein